MSYLAGRGQREDTAVQERAGRKIGLVRSRQGERVRSGADREKGMSGQEQTGRQDMRGILKKICTI